MDFFPKFKWAVPHAFSDALAACRFEQGDILYDTLMAYEGARGEAEKHITYSVQIKHPPRSLSSKVDTDLESAFSSIWRSKVVFELYDHKQKMAKAVETTQGNLYKLLWKGDLEKYKKDETDIPRQAMDLLEEFNGLGEWIASVPQFREHDGGYFILPFDQTSKILKEKYIKILNHLGAHIVSHEIIWASEIKYFCNAEYVPTAKIAFFLLSNQSSEEEVKNAIKKAFYKPVKDSKSGKEYFKVKSHGVLKM